MLYPLNCHERACKTKDTFALNPTPETLNPEHKRHTWMHSGEVTAIECGDEWQTQCALSGAEWKQSPGALALTVQNNAGARLVFCPARAVPMSVSMSVCLAGAAEL